MCISNEALQVSLMPLWGTVREVNTWVEDPKRMPGSSLLLSPLPFLPHTFSFAACWASEGFHGWLPAPTPGGKFSSSWAPSPATSLTAECLPESPLPAGRGERQEVRQEAGDTAATAQGSVSSPSPGPLGQRKPRQEGQSCHQPERPRSTPPPNNHPALRASAPWSFVWYHS